jgi:hypothetical protein
MDDDELIASVARGDDTALRQLFDRHAPWLAARLRKALSAGGRRGRAAGDVPRGGQDRVMTAVALSRPARVLRIEIRRSVVLWAVPLLVALYFFDAFRTAAGFPPIWTVRSSVITTNMIEDFSRAGGHAVLAAAHVPRRGRGAVHRRRTAGDLGAARRCGRLRSASSR